MFSVFLYLYFYTHFVSNSLNFLYFYKCKGCKEEGRRKGEYLGYLHDTGSNPVSVEQTLRVSSDLK